MEHPIGFGQSAYGQGSWSVQSTLYVYTHVSPMKLSSFASKWNGAGGIVASPTTEMRSAPSLMRRDSAPPKARYPVPSGPIAAPGSNGTLHFFVKSDCWSTSDFCSGLVQGPSGCVAVMTPVPHPEFEKYM